MKYSTYTTRRSQERGGGVPFSRALFGGPEGDEGDS